MDVKCLNCGYWWWQPERVDDGEEVSMTVKCPRCGAAFKVRLDSWKKMKRMRERDEEKEMVKIDEDVDDAHAISLICLANEFQCTYKRWAEAWVDLRSRQKVRGLLWELELHSNALSEEVKEDIKKNIKIEDYYTKVALEELRSQYIHLQRLEQKIASVLGKPWEWRDFGDAVVIEESERLCSEQE